MLAPLGSHPRPTPQTLARRTGGASLGRYSLQRPVLLRPHQGRIRHRHNVVPSKHQLPNVLVGIAYRQAAQQSGSPPRKSASIPTDTCRSSASQSSTCHAQCRDPGRRWTDYRGPDDSGSPALRRRRPRLPCWLRQRPLAPRPDPLPRRNPAADVRRSRAIVTPGTILVRHTSRRNGIRVVG